VNADDALREMRALHEGGFNAYPTSIKLWADAIEAELKALREKVAMREAKLDEWERGAK
jgi:hypothetical protein